MSRSFPIALNLEGRTCLVAGDSGDAALRALSLVASGARVRLYAASPSPEHERAAGEPGIELVRRAAREEDLEGAWLAVLTDRDPELASRLSRAAEARRVFFCATDQPEWSSFSHLALARAGVVTLAVGTDGQAPALARKLREELQKLADAAGLERYAREHAELRRKTPSAERRRVLGAAVAGVALEGRLRLPGADD